MAISRRLFLGGAAASVGGAGLLSAQILKSEAALTPEMFGAKGDGVANDTDALARLAAAINAQGGGVVSLGANKTYRVGRQNLIGPASRTLFAYEAGKIMEFRGCSRPLIVRGNGARIKCAEGLLYGTFDPRSGRATRNKMPYVGHGQLATPYTYMIKVENCSGSVEISDVELDGNVQRLRIGGEYGDVGRQIPAFGLALVHNKGSEIVRNVHTHHHAQDGLLINGIDKESRQYPKRLISGVRSEYNCRQGCSLVGGRGYVFEHCAFNHTGKSAFMSAPGAGLDIEAEDKKNRDLRFFDCEFSNNAGCGMVADNGDSEGAIFEDCRFTGTTAWAAWPKMPRFRFNRCKFVGAVANAYGGPAPDRATQFHDCLFTDDPRESSTGAVYLGGLTNGPIVNLGEARNILFSGCSFLVANGAALPWSLSAIYSNCTMRQGSKTPAYPRGTYLGQSTINGPVDLHGSKIVGEIVLNGRRISGAQL